MEASSAEPDCELDSAGAVPSSARGPGGGVVVTVRGIVNNSTTASRPFRSSDLSFRPTIGVTNEPITRAFESSCRPFLTSTGTAAGPSRRSPSGAKTKRSARSCSVERSRDDVADTPRSYAAVAGNGEQRRTEGAKQRSEKIRVVSETYTQSLQYCFAMLAI